MTKSWAYRIIDFGEHLALHEVHFEEGAPISYGTAAAGFVADSEQGPIDIVRALDRAFRAALDHPPIPIADFGEDGS